MVIAGPARQNWPVSYFAGSLLIAMPDLADPNFARTVVLLLEHDAEGAVGVILNRPSEVTPSAELPGWVPLLAPPAVVFLGGPVDPDSAVGLADASGAADTALDADVQLVDLSSEPETAAMPVRVFAGYAGWGPGQLESELTEGAWLLAPVDPLVIFQVERDAMWSHVVRSLGVEPSTLVASRGVH